MLEEGTLRVELRDTDVLPNSGTIALKDGTTLILATAVAAAAAAVDGVAAAAVGGPALLMKSGSLLTSIGGTIIGNVIQESGSVLSPGDIDESPDKDGLNTIGSLEIEGNWTLQQGAIVAFEVQSGEGDQVLVNGGSAFFGKNSTVRVLQLSAGDPPPLDEEITLVSGITDFEEGALPFLETTNIPGRLEAGSLLFIPEGIENITPEPVLEPSPPPPTVLPEPVLQPTPPPPAVLLEPPPPDPQLEIIQFVSENVRLQAPWLPGSYDERFGQREGLTPEIETPVEIERRGWNSQFEDPTRPNACKLLCQ